MKKKLMALGLGLLLVAGIAGCGSKESKTETTQTPQEKQIKVGIAQIVEHPALDAARQGFMEALKKNGYEEGKNLVVDYQNAQGDPNNLQPIAQKFASDKPDLILAIATPSAQAMAGKITDTPILITAVTDPVGAKLVKSAEKPETNVTGTNDMNPIKDQMELLKKLVPTAKAVGVIYNAGEQNSQTQVKLLKEAAAALGLEVKEATVTTTADVMQSAQSMIGKVQALYIPTDNTVVSAAASVIQVADKNKLPIISGESSVVEKGGLATIGIDYKKLGEQTGEMAVRILKGAKPQDMPVESQKDFSITINKKNADLIGITIPEDILAKAAKVIK
ncbi:MAG TPA: ABC transporter substrate-binding protein [Bacillota bacterium]|nr:ABC transporter substrate-binding protein [Bacillota bacterium]